VTDVQPRPSTGTDLTLILPDVVGSLARTFGVLGGAGINVLGHAGFLAWAGEGVLHLLVDDPDAARVALHAAGIEVREEREVLLVPLDDRPGALAGLLELVAKADVNIDLTYVSARGQAILGVSDLARAQAAVAGATADHR
jgi:hypothetical protein